MDTKIKLGIIGTGLAAKNLHLPALLKMKDIYEITAVCNHTIEKAREFSKLVGNVPVFQSYKELLALNNVDAVDIALPIDMNFEVTKAALESGKHVFLEKPLAANMQEAQQMLSFPKQYHQIMMIAENFRYREVFRRVKEIIESGRIGKTYAAQWNLFLGITIESEYAATKWRQNHKYPGGFITDGGVHNIAALRYLFGEVTSVSSLFKSVNPSIGIPDTMSMLLQFDSSIQAVFNIYFSVRGMWENKLLIFGEKGTIGINENEVKIDGSENHTFNDDGGYYLEFLDFYNAITKNTYVKSDFFQGYKDLEVIMKALDYKK